MNETATALILATQTCIAERGITGTTSREITSRAGANLAAITYHFGSKDALIAQALIGGFRTWLQPALDVMSQPGDPGTRTILGVQALVSTLGQHRDQAVAYLEALALSQQSEEVREGIASLWQELLEPLQADIVDMAGVGDIPAWVDPQAMSSLFIAVATGSIIHSLVDVEGPSVSALATQFASLLLSVRQG